MLKIAVCDDEPIFAERLCSLLKNAFDTLSFKAEITSFTAPEPLLTAYETKQFDVVFLDIDMPSMTGFDAARKIRDLSLKTQIVFVTSKHELVYGSFEYTPFYFICKASPTQLESDINQVAEKLTAFFRQYRLITVHDNIIGDMPLEISDIIYIQSDKHYLLYYLHSRADEPLRERCSISEKESSLLCCDFVKSHRQFLANMHHIARLDLLINTITMSNGDSVPISRSLKSEVFEKYAKFKRR